MRHYNFKEIRERGSCVRFAQEVLGAKVVDGRCAAVWRNGTNPESIALDDVKWFDHARNVGGGLIELAAVAKFGGSDSSAIQQAQELLGDWLGLAEVKLRKASPGNGRSRYDELLEDGYELKAKYDYIDLSGRLVYSVYRLEHPTKKKEFVQGTPDHWGLGDVTPIPYNWQSVNASDWCVIVEGEKDVETLRALGIPATTNSGGAKKWRAEFAEYFRGKKIIILPDNDEPGHEHAELVARDLSGVAAGVKIVTVSRLPKGDVTDYFEQVGGTWEAVSAMIREAPEYEAQKLSAVDAAKEANREAFRNFILEEREAGRRKIKEKTPRQINDLIRDLHTRLLGAPFRVGEEMFDQDRDTGSICYIRDAAGLFSWISRKTGCIVEWEKFTGCVTKQEFFEALSASATQYSAISFAPDYPVRRDVYYSHPAIPPASEGYKAFEGFLDFFNPADEVNRCMLAAFVMAPIFYKAATPRPLWIIDSPDGQGSGKSNVAEMVAKLYGSEENGALIDVTPYDLERNFAEVVKRVISTNGRNARIFRLDNVTGTLRSSNLAMLVTESSITGRPSYGRGEESRPNNLTFVATVNGAVVDTDIASRAYYIMVKKPKMSATWSDDILDYIRRNRLQIFGDIIGILDSHHFYNLPLTTRFPKFESLVLQSACGSPEAYQMACEYIAGKRDETNTDEELARQIEEKLEVHLADVKPVLGSMMLNLRTDKIFFRSDVLKEWLKDSELRNPASVIRNMARTKLLDRVSPTVTKWPHNTNDKIKRRHGILWNYEIKGDARVVGIKGREFIEVENETI